MGPEIIARDWGNRNCHSSLHMEVNKKTAGRSQVGGVSSSYGCLWRGPDPRGSKARKENPLRGGEARKETTSDCHNDYERGSHERGSQKGEALLCATM